MQFAKSVRLPPSHGDAADPVAYVIRAQHCRLCVCERASSQKRTTAFLERCCRNWQVAAILRLTGLAPWHTL